MSVWLCLCPSLSVSPQPEADSREEDDGLDTTPCSVGNYAIEYEVKITNCSLNNFKQCFPRIFL